MGCATGLVRVIVFAFNLLCAAVGIALISIASVAIAGIKRYTNNDVDLSQFMIAPGLILAVGIIIFIIAFFGCCGACQNNSCMLTTYAVILLALFIAQLAIGIYGYVKVKDSNEDVLPELKKSFKKAIGHYNETNFKDVTETIDLVQIELQCCGSDGPNDYSLSILTEAPWSCCKNVTIESKHCNSPNNYYEKGCAAKLTELIESLLKTLGYVAMGICATEVIGAVFAMCLASHARNRRG